jgi:predicted metal-binding protein
MAGYKGKVSLAEEDRSGLQDTFGKHEFREFQWIDPTEIVVSQWVRLKCEFGCEDYGKAACPPNLPSIFDCQEFFREYSDAWVFKFTKKSDDTQQNNDWMKKIETKLLNLERAVFLQGHVKAFVLLASNCNLCADCADNREGCNHKRLARPTPEGLGVDVFATVSKLGFPIRVLKDHSEEINRYAILLVQ